MLSMSTFHKHFSQRERIKYPYQMVSAYLGAFHKEIEEQLFDAKEVILPNRLGSLKLVREKKLYTSMLKKRHKRHQFGVDNTIVSLVWNIPDKHHKVSSNIKMMKGRTRFQFKNEITRRIKENPMWIHLLDYKGMK